MIRTAALACLVSLAACAAEGEEDLAELTAGLITWNGLPWSDFGPNLTLVTQTIPGALTGSVPAARLVDTTAGQDVMKYVVACALAAGHTVWLPDSRGAKTKFVGEIGLAPGMLTVTPTLAEQAWVAACVLAHENALGKHVEIDLRGDHPRLQPPSARHTLDEGAFFYDAKVRTFLVCSGKHTALVCGPDAKASMGRTCSDRSGCPATFYCGECATICQPGPNGAWTDCVCNGAVYKQVETSYLDTTGFFQLYGDCG